MLKYVFLSCEIIFEMFSLKFLSVLCMRLSGLEAQHFHRMTALNLCIGVTDAETEASVATPLGMTLLLKLSDPWSQSIGLPEQVK